MKTVSGKQYAENQVKLTEIWYQDVEDSNLWFGEHGVMVNTAALDEREFYFEVIRVPHHPPVKPQERRAHA
jgi:hypothetical protein